MRVLVTGSAGFIGFHLCGRLVREGFDVSGVDNFSRFCGGCELKRERNALLMNGGSPNRFAFEEMDVCDTGGLSLLFSRFKPDVVVHLAAHAGARCSQAEPFAYMHNNCEGFLSVLECCRSCKTSPRLVFASSSSVYGRSASAPFREDQVTGEPLSIYAATKHCNELTAHVYADQYGLQCIGLRFFTVYGSWYRPDMALSLFADALLKGRALTIFNEGDLERDFTYIDDVVEGVIRCMVSGDLGRYEILNIGRSRPEKLMDVISLLARELDVQPRCEFLPMQAGDMRATWADITKLREKIGYSPATTIEEGLPVFCNWFLSYYSRA